MYFWGGFGNKGLIDILEKNKGPSLIEKVDMLFTDVETEGKKRGYDKASKEYKKIFIEIENTYQETKRLIELQKNIYGNKCDKLIDKLESLEYEKEKLKKQVDNKVKEVSRAYNIPQTQILSSMRSGIIANNNIGILDMIYRHKEKKLKKAEQEGYLEAKALYEAKIRKLKEELARLKKDGNREIEKLIKLISEVIDEIVENQMNIAELRILL